MAETFGKTTKGGDSLYLSGQTIRLVKATSGNAGNLQSISVYIKQDTGKNPNIKCAIYDSSFNLLTNGTTEEKQVEDDQDGEMHFNFIASPSITASTEYRLAFWTNDYFYGYKDDGDADQLKEKVVGYNSWPASISGLSQYNWDVTIYATYVEAPTYIPKVIMVQCSSIARENKIYSRFKNLWVPELKNSGFRHRRLASLRE